MTYDVAYRFQQALDPSALVTIGASLHAITRAIDDCRNAGIAFETDPAVILLARHLASVTARQSEDALLKRRCMDRIAELRQHPALLTLAVRGVAHDAAAKGRFHSDGRKALRRLAARGDGVPLFLEEAARMALGLGAERLGADVDVALAAELAHEHGVDAEERGLAGDPQPSGRRGDEPGDGAQQGRLAGAVAADDADRLAVVGDEGDVLHRGDLAVADRRAPARQHPPQPR